MASDSVLMYNCLSRSADATRLFSICVMAIFPSRKGCVSRST